LSLAIFIPLLSSCIHNTIFSIQKQHYFKVIIITSSDIVVDSKLYKPIKVAVTCKLDADIVAWLKQEGKGYQTRLNSILRQVMTHAI